MGAPSRIARHAASLAALTALACPVVGSAQPAITGPFELTDFIGPRPAYNMVTASDGTSHIAVWQGGVWDTALRATVFTTDGVVSEDVLVDPAAELAYAVCVDHVRRRRRHNRR